MLNQLIFKNHKKKSFFFGLFCTVTLTLSWGGGEGEKKGREGVEKKMGALVGGGLKPSKQAFPGL